ncbi:MAG: glycine--tRNA ligase subunit beta [Atopococcus tabaci]|uniref:Glycine--tRNA ligase beta subunit n=1 Tax=Atopococcus tabaci TaxID=269774 RepID=A0AA43RJS2_9LACT|nr:glycine--tRNA ligase subunit beta [Atopococcus tabaci]
MTHQLLLEIGLEEIPARFIIQSEEQLERRVSDFLEEQRLNFKSIQRFSTPRRLTVIVNDLSEKQEDLSEEVRGPAKRIAQDEEGSWTKAAEGFARGQGKTAEDIFFVEEKGEEYAYIQKDTPGKSAQEVLQGLDKIVESMTFPVSMRWARNDFEYIRPIHWIAAVLDDEVIPFQVLDTSSGNTVAGHRFLGADVLVDHVDHYEELLEQQFVIADRNKRQAMIKEQLEELEEAEGFTIDRNQELLDEVTDLVEYPTAFYGHFKKEYLTLPVEILVTSMRDHQRYFSVSDEDGSLKEIFVSVRNGNEDYIENVAQGNEKVISARLDDAMFFYEEDKKVLIEDFNEKLKNVSFYHSLGSMADKVERIRVIGKIIGQKVGLSEQELEDFDRAAELSKFDLSSLMVNEFTELQGVMGSYYAEHGGERPAVVQAIREQYMPTTSEGELPRSNPGAVLALADKLDSVIMFYAAGQIPTGSNDPFALRRQAYGSLRILLDKEWNIYMIELIDEIIASISYPDQEIKENLYEQRQAILTFLKNRIRQHLEAGATKSDIIEAILASSQDNMRNLINNANVLKQHQNEESYKELMESLSRVVNLREKAIESLPEGYELDPAVFETESEKKLYEEISYLLENYDKTTSSTTLYQEFLDMADTISDFFDDNMVMTEDDIKRNNRLLMILELSTIIISFAYVTKLIRK